MEFQINALDDDDDEGMSALFYQKTNENQLHVPDLAFGARGVAHLDTAVT